MKKISNGKDRQVHDTRVKERAGLPSLALWVCAHTEEPSYLHTATASSVQEHKESTSAKAFQNKLAKEVGRKSTKKKSYSTYWKLK